MEKKKPNRYIHLDKQPYWQSRPGWYRAMHQQRWYESIDLREIENDSNEEMADLVHMLVDYIRVREQVIEHRHKVAYHVAFMLDFVMGARGTQYTAEELHGVLKMLREYLLQMFVHSGLSPEAPDQPLSFKDSDNE